MDKTSTIIIIIVSIIVIWGVFSAIKSWIDTKKCEKCGKLGLELFHKEQIDRYNSTKSVRDEVRNKKGEVIRTVYKEVPVTKVVYLCTYKCKYCGHEEKRRSIEEM